MVEDVSMAPLLLPGDRLLVDPHAIRRAGPARGDLVVLDDPDGSGRMLVKSVAAVGPSVVYTVRNGVEVRPAEETGDPPEGAIERTTVPKGSAYVVSTGTAAGRDSRSFGPVPSISLVGVVWWRTGPPGRAGAVRSEGRG